MQLAMRIFFGISLGIAAGTVIGSFFYQSNNSDDIVAGASNPIRAANNSKIADHKVNPKRNLDNFDHETGGYDFMPLAEDKSGILSALDTIADPEIRYLFKEVFLAVRDTANTSYKKLDSIVTRQEKLSLKFNELAKEVTKLKKESLPDSNGISEN